MTTYEPMVERTRGGNSAAVWLLRGGFATVAGVALWQSQLALKRFDQILSTPFSALWGTWALAMALLALSGAAFTFAARVPFSPRGLAWVPLVLALVAALPVAHFPILWVGTERHWPARFLHTYWFDGFKGSGLPYVAAALVGVALASAIGARRTPSAKPTVP
jgi:hypothetical protein